MKLTNRLRAAAVAAFDRADQLAGGAADRLRGWLPGAAEPAPSSLAAEVAARHAAAAERRAAAVAARPPALPPLGDGSRPAEVYGGRSCPWTGRAVNLLQQRDIEHDHIDLDDPELAPLRARLIEQTRQNTVPYVFVRGEFVGGYNALSELDRLGQLELRSLSDDERAARPRGRTRIVIAERPVTDEVAPGEVGTHLTDREPDRVG
jgi:glutaredoxin 3